jgi:addiction module HigA family antidote
MFKNGMRPVHPGEVLQEDFLKPLGLSANALAKALNVPTPRINDVVRKRRGVSRQTYSARSLSVIDAGRILTRCGP